MDPKYGDGVADYSDFEKLAFAIQSKDADNWESFRIIIGSADGRSYSSLMTFFLNSAAPLPHTPADLFASARSPVLLAVGLGAGRTLASVARLSDVFARHNLAEGDKLYWDLKWDGAP